MSEMVVSFALPTAATKIGVTIGASASPETVVHTRMENTDLNGGDDYNVTHYADTNSTRAASTCEAACQADDQCKAWTYVVRGSPAETGDCCLKSAVHCPAHSNICTSGAKVETREQGCPTAAGISCTVEFSSSAVTALRAGNGNVHVPVSCGDGRDTLTLTPLDKELELRIFTDFTFIEAYFQKGRVAMTKTVAAADDTDYFLTSSDADATATNVSVYPMKSPWVSESDIRSQPRVYH